VITQKSVINAILVYLLIFISGSVVFKQASEKYLILALVFSLLAWLLFSDRKINNRFVVYICIFTGFLFTISLYTGGSLSLVSVLSTTMKLLIAYLILKTVGGKFIGTYITVVIFLAVFGLFGYSTDLFGLFDSVIRKLPQIGNGNGYEGMLYVFRRHYSGWGRNASIFYEPGAHQVFLNTALFMLLFVKMKLSGRRRLLYVLILLVTLATTTSTTGYMIAATTLGLFLWTDKSLSFSGKASVVGLILAGLVVFSGQLYTLVVEKISDDLFSVQATSDVGHRRGFDAVVDIEIFKRNLFGVGHKEYGEKFSALGQVTISSAMNSSNGITKTLAIYGLPFTFFLFASYYWAFGRLVGKYLINFVVFGMLMAFFVGEAYYVLSPICLTILAAAFVYDRTIQGEGMKREPEYIS